MKFEPKTAPSTMPVFISTRSLVPADLVVSVSSQLSGIELAVTRFEKRTLFGKFVLLSVVLRAIGKSPKPQGRLLEN